MLRTPSLRILCIFWKVLSFTVDCHSILRVVVLKQSYHSLFTGPTSVILKLWSVGHLHLKLLCAHGNADFQAPLQALWIRIDPWLMKKYASLFKKYLRDFLVTLLLLFNSGLIFLESESILCMISIFRNSSKNSFMRKPMADFVSCSSCTCKECIFSSCCTNGL